MGRGRTGDAMSSRRWELRGAFLFKCVLLANGGGGGGGDRKRERVER